jgi:hypothetical protein
MKLISGQSILKISKTHFYFIRKFTNGKRVQ